MRPSLEATGSLPLLAEDPQQEEKEVDEVEIEGERAHDRGASLRVAREALTADLRELLHVVRGESREDRHPRIRRDPVERVVRPEDVHDRRQDQPDQGHEGDRSELGQIGVRDRAPDGERAEHPGRDQEGSEDRLRRVELEDEGEGDTDRRRVEEEEDGREPYRDPVDREAQPEDDRELNDDDSDDQAGGLRDVGEQGFARADQGGDAAGDPKADEHPEEDTLKEPGFLTSHRHGRLCRVLHGGGRYSLPETFAMRMTGKRLIEIVRPTPIRFRDCDRQRSLGVETPVATTWLSRLL